MVVRLQNPWQGRFRSTFVTRLMKNTTFSAVFKEVYCFFNDFTQELTNITNYNGFRGLNPEVQVITMVSVA